ncbi:MAG: Ig-like domain-containing protein [Muribaculaceae bacterium]|nr:Ig-like domain-containing protein [Muribaculaceae bacterium]
MNRYNTPYLILAFFIFLASACASIGNPSGGPRDEDPPSFVRSNPSPGTVNFKGDRVDIYFDELVNVKDAFSKVIVSPPSSQTPRVSSLGKRVSVQFADTLLPNTTYTIDFADAIEDNNEQNKLENFNFSFSTGPTIDSLRISGMVLGANDLEPLRGKLVGVHSNLNDSSFLKTPFLRMARTDDVGRFSIAGLAPGHYRVFALNDNDNDLKYSSPEEEIGFYDFVVSPSVSSTIAYDSIFNSKTGQADTVVSRIRPVFLPNDILIRSFTSAFRQQYLKNYERIDTTRLSFQFNSISLTPPEFSVVGAPKLKDWYVRESSQSNDSITLWIKNRSLISADTLRIAVRYMRNDSLKNLSPFTDTLRMVFDRKLHERVAAQTLKDLMKQAKANRRDSARLNTPPSLSINFTSSTIPDIESDVTFTTETPLLSLNKEGVHLEMMKDSVWIPIAIDSIRMPDPLKPRNFSISHPWKYNTEYKVRIDSLAATGIYGLQNAPSVFAFKTGAQADYSSIKFRISGIPDSIPAFVQLLNNDSPVKAMMVKNNSVIFRHLKPGKYYARIVIDFNGNGVYDPGDYEKGTQPDLTFYYPKSITLKKNWDKEETWNIFATPVDKQKPNAIRKNLPKNAKTEASEEEEED